MSHIHIHDSEDRQCHSNAEKPANTGLVTDPVCGMTIDPAAAIPLAHGGNTHYFCSTGCRDKFSAAPETYLGEQQRELPRTTVAGAIYTCPMHPEVRREGPGACPKCGMALEPESPTVDEGESTELKDMTRRFWISLILSLPVLALSMGEMVPALDLGRQIGHSVSGWIQFALATPVVLWAGLPFSSAAGNPCSIAVSTCFH